MTALQKSIAVLGSQSALAKALGVVPQVVNNWLRRGRVPAEHCPDIERITAAAGEVVMCEELRPDVDWAYLRGSPSSRIQSPEEAVA